MAGKTDDPPPQASAAEIAGVAKMRVAFWRRVQAFRDLSETGCSALSAISRPQTWAPGAMLFHRDDESTYMVAVESGRIRLSLQTSGGREFALRHIGPGMLFGEIGVLDGSPRSADAMAVLQTAGYVVERRQFRSLMDHHPEIAQATIRHLCSLLRYTTDHIETIALYDLKARIARFILAQLDRQNPAGAAGEPIIRLELNQSDIADLLGASRPKVNRALVDLEKAEAISRKGKMMMCDRKKLTLLADAEDR